MHAFIHKKHNMVLFGSNCAGGDDKGGCFGVDLWLCWVHSPEQFSPSRSWKRTLHYHYFLRFHSLTQQVTSACPLQCAHNGVHHRWHNGKWCELWWWYCFSVAMLLLVVWESEVLCLWRQHTSTPLCQPDDCDSCCCCCCNSLSFFTLSFTEMVFGFSSSRFCAFHYPVTLFFDPIYYRHSWINHSLKITQTHSFSLFHFSVVV